MKGFLCLLGLGIALGGLLLLPKVSVAQNVDNFTIGSFTADYYLSRDSEKVSQLRVVEHIVAEFPATNQNHGILRAIPKTYDKHPLDLKIESITDTTGKNIPYSESESNDNLVLRIGDANIFVHGSQHYQITYTMRHVTKNFEDHDELYWDVNGDQWQQVFGVVTARIHLPLDLTQTYEPQCFTGQFGSTETACKITKNQQAGEQVVVISTTRSLQPRETLSFVLGFEKDSFAAYSVPLGQSIGLAALWFGPPLLALFFMIRNWLKYGRDPRGKGTIVPEYLSPKDLSVLASSAILFEGFKPNSITAQIIDLAVRHYIKIYEVTKDRKLLPDQKLYELELVKSPLDLRSEEREVVDMIFGKAATLGKRVNLKDLANDLYGEAAELGKSIDKQLSKDGYFRLAPNRAKAPYIVVGTLCMLGVFFGIPHSLGIVVAGLILLIGANAMPARTKKGVDVRDYLLGLKMYMKLAEAERLKVLQSPHGELTEKIDVNDTTQLVKLYEHLLPYAMLFGIERDWAKVFSELYTQPPDWYSGSTTFQAAWFVSSLQGFRAASTTSFTPPNSSSSSGVGGGFSGGGGGGGGGGGW